LFVLLYLILPRDGKTQPL